MTLDTITDWLSLSTAAVAVGLAAGLLLRAILDRRHLRRSGQNGALAVVSGTAVAIEALRLTMAGLLLGYAILALPLAGTTLQFHVSRWLHIVMALVMTVSAVYHQRQRGRLLAILRGGDHG